MAHWVWGGGWMGRIGVLDFAGGAVVHMSSGASALAAAMFLGRRKGYGTADLMPHNLPLTILGAGLLWFGWFGFNAGSALAVNGLAVNAFVVTHLSAAAAALSWLVLEWRHRGNPTTLGAASGAVAGLVAITPAAGFVGPMAAVVIGMVAGLVCYYGVFLKSKLGYDDSLDVVGIHGLGGTWGALATGLYAKEAIGGASGIFYGHAPQLGIQAISVAATWIFSFLATVVILKAVDLLVGLRVSEEDEVRGLDISQHSEAGYNLA
jgi:Amt family ammonium transporter